MEKIALEYIPGGFIPDIPARDLTEAEVKQYGGEAALLKTGRYKKPRAKAEMPVEEKE